MRVLVFTNMYPFAAMPFYGSFVKDEVESLRAAGVDVGVVRKLIKLYEGLCGR